MDDMILDALSDSKVSEQQPEAVRQVVVLGAGMDTRAWRMDLPEGTLPILQNHKAHLLFPIKIPYLVLPQSRHGRELLRPLPNLLQGAVKSTSILSRWMT